MSMDADGDYFKSYENLSSHDVMLKDKRRLNFYREFCSACDSKFIREKVVLDLGQCLQFSSEAVRVVCLQLNSIFTYMLIICGINCMPFFSSVLLKCKRNSLLSSSAQKWKCLVLVSVLSACKTDLNLIRF